MAQLTGCIGVAITGITTGSAVVAYETYFSTDTQADTAVTTIAAASTGTVRGWINGAGSGNAGLFNSVSRPLSAPFPPPPPLAPTAEAHSSPRLA